MGWIDHFLIRLHSGMNSSIQTPSSTRMINQPQPRSVKIKNSNVRRKRQSRTITLNGPDFLYSHLPPFICAFIYLIMGILVRQNLFFLSDHLHIPFHTRSNLGFIWYAFIAISPVEKQNYWWQHSLHISSPWAMSILDHTLPSRMPHCCH